MAENHHTRQTLVAELPKILILGPTGVLPFFQSHYSDQFHFLNAEGSSLPLDQFLASENINPSSIRALLCYPYSPVTYDVLQLLPSLKLVATHSVGFEHIDLHECQRRGIEVAGAGNLFSQDVADMAVGLLIDVMRKISAGDRFVRNLSQTCNWDFPLGTKVSGKKIGILGLGRIGLEVAKRVESFGCKVFYCSRKQKPNISYTCYPNLVDLAAASDALVVCCSLNKETHHMVNEEVMLALGKNGVLINVGRGAIIDEKKLVGCLVEGKIGGAGLDVFEDEPNVPKELFGLDNVVLSPHRGPATSECILGMHKLLMENFIAFFSNKPLLTPINDC